MTEEKDEEERGRRNERGMNKRTGYVGPDRQKGRARKERREREKENRIVHHLASDGGLALRGRN